MRPGLLRIIAGCTARYYSGGCCVPSDDQCWYTVGPLDFRDKGDIPSFAESCDWGCQCGRPALVEESGEYLGERVRKHVRLVVHRPGQCHLALVPFEERLSDL